MKTCPTCKSNHNDHYSHCPLDGTALVEANPWTEGAVIRGKYQILERVGRGGMGAVYKAQHVRFKEVCALKVMSQELAKDHLFLKRFENEAVLTRRLNHPNAVRVDDFDEADDGRPFIVMEYIDGRSLKEAIAQEAPFPLARACSIAKQVASALDAAHRLGMVHRDIKPDNIVLLDGGTQSPGFAVSRQSGQPVAKVLDFGIAKIKEGLFDTTAAGMTLTGTGVAIGTPSYMSPEQALGKKGDELDGRSDIYSLGVVMYQMLSGELPFQADTPIQMMMAHIQMPARPLQETPHGARIPQELAELVMSCLEKNPELRPGTGQALIDAIENCEARQPFSDAAPKEDDEAPPKPAAQGLSLSAGAAAASSVADEISRGSLVDRPPVVNPGPARASNNSSPGPEIIEATVPSVRAPQVPSRAFRKWPLGVAVACVAAALAGLYIGLRPPGTGSTSKLNGPDTGLPGAARSVHGTAQQGQVQRQSTPSTTASGAPPETAAGALNSDPQSGEDTSSARSNGGLETGAPGMSAPPALPMKPKGPARVHMTAEEQAAKKIFAPAPEYPQFARMAHVEGLVRLSAVIGRDGTVKELKLISGPPLLIAGTMNAVSKWRYQPTLLNGEPVDVVTEIGVNFRLQHP